MSKTTKKIFCTTAITAILNLSLQPAYAGKSDLSLASEETSYTQKVSHHLSKKSLYKERMSDPSLESPQTHTLKTSQTTETDVVSTFLSTPLKTIVGAVSLVKKGVRFVLENPGKAITTGFFLQSVTNAAALSLSSLTATQGFNITGIAANDFSGFSVSSAGDFNGDGLGDLIIGALGVNGYTGKSYVIYGTNSTPSSINLSSLTRLQGFAINGIAANDNLGWSVSSAGDFNGDGLGDVIMGAPFANNAAGSSYVIYGTNSKPSSINLSSLTRLQGFNITGIAAYDFSGKSVSSAGDFNGDGFSDVIIGVHSANNFVGKSYVIYGTNSQPSSISLSSLTSLQGFVINGAAASEYSGFSVSSAGDFNGDGFNEVIIGATGANSFAGKSYVIYGTNSKPNSISLSSLTSLQGFAINGDAANDNLGSSVFSAGDFNGDGLSDLIIGVPGYSTNDAGSSYIIYGTNSPPSSISLSSLTLNQGFAINGVVANGNFGSSVSSAGDFNGDGFSDVIIGTSGANNFPGKSYVIYGTNSTPSSISLSSLTSLQGFNITGIAADGNSDFPVSSAGDFNGDGFSDVLVGVPDANNYVGKSYVIYGAPTPSPTNTSIMTSAGSNQMASTNPTLSPASTTFGPNSGGQDQAGEVHSQSLSKWLAGAALLIGQERF